MVFDSPANIDVHTKITVDINHINKTAACRSTLILCIFKNGTWAVPHRCYIYVENNNGICCLYEHRVGARLCCARCICLILFCRMPKALPLRN